LNPIEIIWAIMKKRVKKFRPKREGELKQVICPVWEELDQAVLTRLVLSFNNRLELVIRVRGRSISQYLSSHRNQPTGEDASANQDFRPFEAEEDEPILWRVERLGNRWKRITEILAPRFGQRDRCQIKHRAKFLMDRIANERLAQGDQDTLAEQQREEASLDMRESMGEAILPPPECIMNSLKFRP
jgi:hypothetical protein